MNHNEKDPHSPNSPQQPCASDSTAAAYALPPLVLSDYDTIKKTLTSNFISQPPHTIQRIAELVLRPTQHYRFLPSYLNALDRVLSVSSGSDAFPLPAIDAPVPPGPLVNGNTTSTATNGLGSDQGLGGALLTPIPWLRHDGSPDVSSDQRRRSSGTSSDTADESILAEDATPRDGEAMTQGELLRKEQENSSPPAPVAALPHRTHAVALAQDPDGIITPEAEAMGEEHEQPHARGPDEIGMEDTGPQDHPLGEGQVLNMQAAMGRAPQQQQRTKGEGREDGESDAEEQPEIVGQVNTEQKDGDGDTVIKDADETAEHDEKPPTTSEDAAESEASKDA